MELKVREHERLSVVRVGPRYGSLSIAGDCDGGRRTR